MKFKPGDRVRFIDGKKHAQEPRYYPPMGTVGQVREVDADGDLLIEWEEYTLPDGTNWSVVMPKRVEHFRREDEL